MKKFSKQLIQPLQPTRPTLTTAGADGQPPFEFKFWSRILDETKIVEFWDLDKTEEPEELVESIQSARGLMTPDVGSTVKKNSYCRMRSTSMNRCPKSKLSSSCRRERPFTVLPSEGFQLSDGKDDLCRQKFPVSDTWMWKPKSRPP